MKPIPPLPSAGRSLPPTPPGIGGVPTPLVLRGVPPPIQTTAAPALPLEPPTAEIIFTGPDERGRADTHPTLREGVPTHPVPGGVPLPPAPLCSDHPHSSPPVPQWGGYLPLSGYIHLDVISHGVLVGEAGLRAGIGQGGYPPLMCLWCKMTSCPFYTLKC